MKKRRTVRHGIQGIFVFVLLALFALMSVLLVLFGAQMYRGVVDEIGRSDTQRVLSSYVRTMVRTHDDDGSVRVEEHGEVTALGLYEQIGGVDYVTWLYEYNGMLCEQFTRAGGELLPDHGVEITPVLTFKPKLEGRLLTVEMTDTDGLPVVVQTALRCTPL